MGMPCLDACIYFIIASLSVAYPILLQVISRLDDRYSSARAVDLFDRELARRGFVYCLGAAVAAVALWFCHLPAPAWALASAAWWAGGVVNSALLLVYSCTAGMLVCFFLLTDKVLTYYNTQKLSAYLQRRHARRPSTDRYFAILTDVFAASVAAKNSPVLLQLADFFSEQFHLARTRAVGGEVVYPAAYYQLVYRATEELALLGDRKHRTLAHRAAGGGWLLGGHEHQLLSEETYAVLWRTNRLALDYGQEDMVYDYWRTAHQYAEHCLKPVQPDYPIHGPGEQPANQAAVALRQQERARFWEFHQVLGALLLYTGRLALLRRLFDYTTSQPPHYVLLPDRVDDIFTAFVGYWYPVGRPLPIDATYSFPNEAGLASEGLITKWLNTYLAVLFLRQYTLGHYLVGDAPLACPRPPDGQPAKQQWLDALEPFRQAVARVLHDARLLQGLELDFLTEAWCQQRHVPYPLALLDAWQQQLLTAYQRGAKELPLSAEKVAEFYADSGPLLAQAAEALQQLAAPAGARPLEAAHHLRGRQALTSKDYFSANPEVTHLGASTDLARRVRSGLRDELAYFFVSRQAAEYRVRQAEVFAALDQLGLDDRHLIVNLGVRLSYLASEQELTNYQANAYKGVPVLDFSVPSYADSLLVLERAALPAMRWLPPDVAEVAKFGLTEISLDFPLYAAVLDGNNLPAAVEAEVLNGDYGIGDAADLLSQALEVIWLCLEIQWQQGARVVRLISHGPYGRDQPVDDLANISPF